ncbi:polyprenyl synthetase family protein [Candidatus Altiarchaeota archaeon]
MDITNVLRQKSEKVEDILREYTKIGDKSIQEMISHPISAGGKRIRPFLVFMGCEAVGGDPDSILPAAASVELLHTFTLIHDDIMDHDTERRGKPTVHVLWGEELAIVVGDTMYSGAFKALVDLRKMGFPEGIVLDCVQSLVEANSELQEGQILDMMFEERDIISEEEYMGMISKKTGSLIDASLRIGCILGNGSQEELNALSVYGRNIGIAFQVKDDLLDLMAEPSELGKPVGSDIRKGKKTLIIVHALNNADPSQKDEINSVLGDNKATDDQVRETIDLLTEIGSIQYAKDTIVRLMDEGVRSLKILKDSEAKQHLTSLSEYLIVRRK